MQSAAIRKAVRLPPWCLLAAVGIITSGRRACAQEARKRTSATEQPSAIAPISIGRTSLVSPDRPEDPFFETALAADPADPQHLIGAAIEFGRDGSSGTAVYVSWDGGSTWTRSRRVGTDSTMFSGLDPVVLFGPDGIPYYVHSHDRVYVHQSLDGGRTWQPATVVPGGSYDREFLVVDRTGRHRGRMYLAGLLDLDRLDGSRVGTIGFSTSADSGKTFTEPRRLTEDEGAWMMAMDLAVTPDGTILVPYKTGRVNAKGETDSVSLRMARSTDGGLSFTRSSEIGSVVWPTSLRGRAQSVSPLVPIAIDRTHGPYDGRIYLAWADYGSAGDGSAFRIRVASSADTGLSWSIATVSDDAVLADRTTAAIAVDSTGMVGVTWYDRGDDVADHCQRLYFAVSFDGGATFTRKAVAAPAQRLCPAAPANWIPRGYAFLNTDRPLSPDGKPVDAVGLFSPTARFRDGGDTQGLVAGQAGVFHALWIGGGRGGLAQPMHTTITIDTTLLATARDALGVDVTSDVALDVGPVRIDTVARTITVPVTLAKRARVPLQLPLTLRLVAWRTTVHGLRATATTNHQEGIGAQWTVTTADSVLAPGAQSATLTLRFRYDDGSPVAPNGVEPLRLAFRVFARYRTTPATYERPRRR